MPNRPGNEDRTAGGSVSDRERQREIATDGARDQSQSTPRTRSNRGFASMDASKQREIASKGGKAAHAKGTAHEFDSGEAREAGRKGGVAVSRNREHMAAIGRRGGEARGHARAKSTPGAQSNSGSDVSTEGSFQNSRGSAPDRQVGFTEQSDSVSSSPQGNRGGNSSMGGERRAGSSDSASRDSFGNH